MLKVMIVDEAIERAVHYVARVGLDNIKQRVVEDGENRRAFMGACVLHCRASPIRGAHARREPRRANSKCWRHNAMSLPERVALTVAGEPVVHHDASAGTTETNVDGWQKGCALEAIPILGARVVKSAQGNIAVFRTADDAVFALDDKCPHKGGPLSQGIVFGRKVACPLHNWNIGLEDGNAVAPDKGCTRSYPVKIEGGAVFLQGAALPPQ